MTDIIADEYYSVGGNRHSAAADWSATSGFLAFGADQNIAIWSPQNGSAPGLSAVLRGHTDQVTAVRFLPGPKNSSSETLVTGAADGQICLWKRTLLNNTWTFIGATPGHTGTINAIATDERGSIFATGGADAKVKLWRVEGETVVISCELQLKPRFIPLALSIGSFPHTADAAFLVVGGTRTDIQVYSIETLASRPQLSLHATLGGHEAWIRALALTSTPEGGFLLASASQDKYIRIWRFQLSNTDSVLKKDKAIDPSLDNTILTAKVQSVSAGDHKYSITFEALLLGHEDWIYSATWNPKTAIPQLLTASADGSLSIWEPEESSGVWVSISRLGEISGQKGATTATGSSGGFWIGLWAPDGSMVTCLGRTGSWRLWIYSSETRFWKQQHGISGHINSVNGICWSPNGSYLLSTSSDQTTRLHAEWRKGEKRSWHEFSRPQIHGYDLNSIASTTPHQFVSGADEKLLRVFNEPKDIATMLHKLCQVPLPAEAISLPDTAAIPVLGLSNKAVADGEDNQEEVMSGNLDLKTTPTEQVPGLWDMDEPPNEDLLARHTLWPEHEKLYGHGYEVSEVATPSDGSLLATACKASSMDHAVIRLYDTSHWNEIKPPLTAHSLTVTRLALSSGTPRLILSVGRDRQWTVFGQPSDSTEWVPCATNPKAHTRMILDCSWLSNTDRPVFVTAGRDKVVKLWAAQEGSTQLDFANVLEIKKKSAVTAVATISKHSRSFLATGEEDGNITIHILSHEGRFKDVHNLDVEARFCPTKAVNRLAWRPNIADAGTDQLAVAASDGSVRILKFDWEHLSRK